MIKESRNEPHIIKSIRIFKKASAISALAILLLVLSACALIDDIIDAYERPSGQSFAEARSNFTTTLTRQVNNQNEIPTPPQGVFDLVYYQSEVGNLAAFVSSDPGDGQRHPLIIWIVGGWGYGISDLPWSYPEWDNDQTGSAFKSAGILMMYPSFRGANGNPGYFETLYGDIDDILAAYRFAASLPYVDPDRIYLGGHSTGGTRVLLASALTDYFRAVFSFGPVDDIGNHNRAQFTFDLNDREERRMRSPIHWLGDIVSPTFIIEGESGTAVDLRNMENRSNNENIHIFIVEGGDHFDVLAPITRLLAQKVAADTGPNVNISLTDSEIQNAMNNRPTQSPMPMMGPHYNEVYGIRFLLPAIWDESLAGDQSAFVYTAPFHDDNFWETSYMILEMYELEDILSPEEFEEILGLDVTIFERRETQVGHKRAFVWEGTAQFETLYYNKIVMIQEDERLAIFDFLVPEIYQNDAMPMFEQIMYSISFE